MIYNFEKIKNARDLGGIKTADGRTVKSEMLFRTAGLFDASENDINRLCEFGISKIIDLRDEYEISKEPDKKIPTATHHIISALPPIEPYDNFSPDELQDLFENSIEKIFKVIYKDLAESEISINAYKKFFNIVLSADGAPVLWHCTQGKDRTGIGAILLLSSLGVSLDTAIDEYFITNKIMKNEFKLYQLESPSENQFNAFRTTMFVHRECIDIYIHSVLSNYGSVENYIKSSLGVSKSDIEELQKRYLY